MRPLDGGDVQDVLARNDVEENQVAGHHTIVAVAAECVDIATKWIVAHRPKSFEEEISVASRKPCDGDLDVVWHVDLPHRSPLLPVSRSRRAESPHVQLRWP